MATERTPASPDPAPGAGEAPAGGTGGRRPAGRFDGTRPDVHRAGMAELTLGALGVVFGNIGTSPLYAVQTVFTADNHAVGTGQVEVYGIIR